MQASSEMITFTGDVLSWGFVARCWVR